MHFKKDLYILLVSIFFYIEAGNSNTSAQNDKKAADGIIDIHDAIASIDTFHRRLREKCSNLLLTPTYQGAITSSETAGFDSQTEKTCVWAIGRTKEKNLENRESDEILVYFKLVRKREAQVSIKVKSIELHFCLFDSEGNNAEKVLMPHSMKTFKNLILSLDDSVTHDKK